MSLAVFRSIAFQFACFIALVVLYNRLIYGLHSISSDPSFSTWAAPLYAAALPIPPISALVLLRWCVPVLLAVIWIAIVMRWTFPVAPPDAGLWNDKAGSSTARSSLPKLSARLRTAIGFILLLNLTTCMMDAGVKSITWPFSRIGDEYFGDAEHLESPLHLLRDYPTMTLSRHAHTHPPGGVLLLWVVRKAVGDGLLRASLVAIVLTALTLIPAARLARHFLSDTSLTLFVGLYALTPNLVLFGATSMDGVFALVLVTAAMVFFDSALRHASASDSVMRGIHIGLWLAIAIFFTYATLALIVLFIAWWALRRFPSRTFVMLGVAAITIVAIYVVLYLTAGCNILACVRSSMAFDRNLMQEVRPHYWDVSFTNLLGFLVGSGMIATTLWMRSLRGESAVAVLSRALGITLVVLSFSTLFTRELERVWMFLTPILLIGAADALARIESAPLRRRWIIAAMVLLFAQTWLTQLTLNTIW